MKWTKSARVKATREVAWRVLTDVERWPQWTASMTRITRLDEGALRAGSRARVEQPGIRPMVWTIIRFEPESRFDWETRSAGIHIVAGHRIESAGDELIFTNDLQMTGWLSALLAPFIRGRVARFLAMETEGWKCQSESLFNKTSVSED